MVHAIIVTVDTWGKIQFFNQGGEKITGYSQKEVKGKYWLDLMVPKERFLEVHTKLSLLIPDKLPANFENPILTKGGEEKIISWQNNAIIENGTIIGAVSVGIDITEKKIAEKKLLSSEQQFRQIAEMLPAPVRFSNEKGQVLFVNKAFTQLLGYTVKDIPTTSQWFLKAYPDKVYREEVMAKWNATIDNIHKGNIHNAGQLKVACKNKTERYFDITTSLSNGNVYALFNDVTDRKQKEEQLKSSEEKFRNLAESLPIPIRYSDSSGKIIFINKAFTQQLGYCLKDISSIEKWFSKAYPNKDYREQRQEQSNIDLKEINQGKTTVSDIIEIWCKNKSKKFFEVTKTLINENVYAVFNDVTQKRIAELLLKESEEKFRSLAENLPIPIGCYNVDTRIVSFVNKRFVEVLGYTLKDVPNIDTWQKKTKQCPSLKQLKEEQNPLAIAFLNREINVLPEFESSIKSKDGTVKKFLLTYTVLENLTYTIFNDITEKRKAEEELIQSHKQLRELASYLQTVREQERTGIAREIHDELGQMVTGLKIEMSWLKKGLPETEVKLQEKVAGMIAMLDDTVKVVRKISSDLRPSILDDIGLSAALDWHGKEFAEKTKVACSFTNKVGDINLPVDIATALFRIFQESLTNIMRHAEATKVSSSLTMEGNVIVLSIKDNGKGFDANEKKGTLGLLGMKERAIMINGTLEIKSQPGKGTTTIVKAPLNL